MGVLGLWRLLEATGNPVPLETLEEKVLAIGRFWFVFHALLQTISRSMSTMSRYSIILDVSIWIHQVIQGYQDHRGNSLPNAHLIGLFNRICKLMYFKIKPIFVFDGGVPLLKKNTIVSMCLFWIALYMFFFFKLHRLSQSFFKYL